MDKSWILSDRLSIAYEEGVNAFLEFAKCNSPNSNVIPCPCVNCINLCHTSIKNARYRLFKHGFDENYIDWTFHGENSSKDEADQCPNESRPPEFDYTKEMLHDAFTYAENEPNLLRSLLEECDKPLQHSQTFIDWFKKEVEKRLANRENTGDSVRWLEKGPDFAMASGSDSEREEDAVSCSGSDSDYEEDAVSRFGSDSDREEDAVSASGSGSKSHRGPTIKAKANKKTVVTYNKRGVPTGPGAKKLSTFEGLVARSMVPITYDSWLNVDNEKRKLVGNMLSRKQVLQSTGIMWKNFKHYLYKKFIKPLKDDKSKEAKKQLYTPPGKYPSVNKKDWKLFAISQKASANRKRNKSNHRLSRKGYAGLISEIMEETGKEEEEIDRAECWKKAREKKTGGFDPDVQKVVDKIEQLKKDKDYSDDPMGTIDLLTEALGTVEQRGRVRGMGRFVTPNQYFLIPRNVKQYLKQYDNMMNKRLKAVEDELARRRSRCASTNASEGGSNSPTLSDEDEPPNVPTERNDKSCYLAVDDPSNIVAKGTIVKHTGSVTVDKSVQPEALIPNPIPEEFVETVKDAIGTR
ncbi:transposase, Ptta/En/Spm [Artemisia annua]|uniref:Transposase, Ptta/En/Spm n=1 Tax=Artemisia annua TaxID=35608 RepID=A0A2U1L522_ARTAN|nr:transposase, Ptta/En/Spm [Artemisia annua]